MGFGVPRDPSVVDLADRHGIQVVELLATLLVGDDELRGLEQAEVLHHAEAGHLGERLDKARQSLAVVIGQRVEQRPTRGVRERLEHVVEVVHVGHDR
mgnify:CR=1 FL=1